MARVAIFRPASRVLNRLLIHLVNRQASLIHQARFHRLGAIILHLSSLIVLIDQDCRLLDDRHDRSVVICVSGLIDHAIHSLARVVPLR